MPLIPDACKAILQPEPLGIKRHEIAVRIPEIFILGGKLVLSVGAYLGALAPAPSISGGSSYGRSGRPPPPH